MAACPSLVVCALSSQTRSSSCVCNLYFRGCETWSWVFNYASKATGHGEVNPGCMVRAHLHTFAWINRLRIRSYFSVKILWSPWKLLLSKSLEIMADALTKPCTVCIHRKLPMLWQGLKTLTGWGCRFALAHHA